MRERLAEDLGGGRSDSPTSIAPLYHAAAVFASNYLVAATGVAEQLFATAGVPDPLAGDAPAAARDARRTSRVLGPARALTGPAVRGDAGTIAGTSRH